jgi:hypothetical protein
MKYLVQVTFCKTKISGGCIKLQNRLIKAPQRWKLFQPPTAARICQKGASPEVGPCLWTWLKNTGFNFACLETDFSVKFCTCDSIRTGGCHLTLTSYRGVGSRNGHTFPKGGFTSYPQCPHMLQQWLGSCGVNLLCIPQRNYSWERCLLDYPFKSKTWPRRSHQHLAMSVPRCECSLILKSFGDLNYLSHYEESSSSKAFRMVLLKDAFSPTLQKNLSNFDDTLLAVDIAMGVSGGGTDLTHSNFPFPYLICF